MADVLANLDRQRLAPEARRKLRLVAILHDTMKGEVDGARPPAGENHHAVRARRYAEAYVDDKDVLELVELHDEAYNAWAAGQRRGRWDRAEDRAWRLVERLGSRLPLFLAFFRADNATGDKRPDPVRWFEALVRRAEPARRPGSLPGRTAPTMR